MKSRLPFSTRKRFYFFIFISPLHSFCTQTALVSLFTETTLRPLLIALILFISLTTANTHQADLLVSHRGQKRSNKMNTHLSFCNDDPPPPAKPHTSCSNISSLVEGELHHKSREMGSVSQFNGLPPIK